MGVGGGSGGVGRVSDGKQTIHSNTFLKPIPPSKAGVFIASFLSRPVNIQGVWKLKRSRKSRSSDLEFWLILATNAMNVYLFQSAIDYLEGTSSGCRKFSCWINIVNLYPAESSYFSSGLFILRVHSTCLFHSNSIRATVLDTPYTNPPPPNHFLYN